MAEQQIIIKKSDDHDDHEHHGGGWKVAYADFMTAMMAFFLMLWIITAADQQKKEGLAEFFTPTEANQLRGGQGFLDGQVFGPDGVFAGVDGQRFQIQPPSFGRETPISVPGISQDDPAPRVVVEYAPAPQLDQTGASGAQGDTTGAGTAATPQDAPVDPQRLADAQTRAARLDAVTDEIAAAVAQNMALVEMESHLRIDRTPEGLLIQILDQENRPMFASGSARIDGPTRALVQIIALAVADLDYPLEITGHTDAVPFTGRADYSNWELSADRANATRRALVTSGIQPARIARVSGLAETRPLNQANPLAPENRRISMLLFYPDPLLAGPDSARGGGEGR
jgi:chemotaxis protein MotB